MKLNPIAESEFINIVPSRRIIAHDCPSKFAAFDLGSQRYGLSWRSDIISPIVKLSPDGKTVWIGIDQQLAAVNLENGRVMVALPFTTYIVDLLTAESTTAVLTELELLLFNPGGAIRFSEELPDQGAGMSLVGDNLEIEMIEGEILTVNLMTGTIAPKQDRTPKPMLHPNSKTMTLLK